MSTDLTSTFGIFHNKIDLIKRCSSIIIEVRKFDHLCRDEFPYVLFLDQLQVSRHNPRSLQSNNTLTLLFCRADAAVLLYHQIPLIIAPYFRLEWGSVCRLPVDVTAHKLRR